MAKTSNEVISTMQQWFEKAPALPKNARETLVRITPILALVFGILGILGSIAGLGLLTALSPFAVFTGAAGMSSYGTGFIAALIWLAASALMLAAVPGLKAHTSNGWNLLFWSEITHFVGSIIALSIVSGIISALIVFYLLFQIRSYYK